MQKVAVIGTGGTISSIGANSLDVLDYPDFGQKRSVEELLAHFPETSHVAHPLPIPFRSVGSTAIGPADWLELRTLVLTTVQNHPSIAGIIITHGTATLEETAFFLHMTLDLPIPVVLVGAQRPSSALGTDAGANLVAALRVAAAPEARGLGVLMVMNDEIHSARDVVKTSTYRVQTFRSLDFGALGHVDGDGVHILRKPTRPHGLFASETTLDLPRVDIVLSYAGADACMVDAAIAAGARGIVSAALPPGIATPLETEALERAAASGIVIVQSSRAASGRVGSRRFLREAGFVPAQDFSPQKARILLMLALTRTTEIAEIAALFARS